LVGVQPDQPDQEQHPAEQVTQRVKGEGSRQGYLAQVTKVDAQEAQKGRKNDQHPGQYGCQSTPPLEI
jgi:hypothetical protein